jgi:hypothetical protein
LSALEKPNTSYCRATFFSEILGTIKKLILRNIIAVDIELFSGTQLLYTKLSFENYY